MNTSKITTSELIIIIIIMMGLINGLMSCSSGRSLYQRDLEGKVWKVGPKTSSVTGWKYSK